MSEGTASPGAKSALNVTGPAVVISAKNATSYSGGRCAKIIVTVAGTTTGAAYDAATVAGAVAANLIFVIPNVSGIYLVDFPYLNGLLIVPGTGQTVSVAYD